MRWIAKVKIIKREEKKLTRLSKKKSNVAKDQKMTSKITF